MSETRRLEASTNIWKQLCVVIALVSMTGCGSTEVTDAVALDQQIEEKWIANRKVVDAIPFLEGGGHYENLGNPDEVPIDVPHVLPLLKRFRDELALKPVAVLESPELAMAILVELPSSSAQRKRLGEVLQEADDDFPGLLMDNWGQKWLSLDFLDERETEALQSSGSLELIEKEHQFQRRQGSETSRGPD